MKDVWCASVGVCPNILCIVNVSYFFNSYDCFEYKIHILVTVRVYYTSCISYYIMLTIFIVARVNIEDMLHQYRRDSFFLFQIHSGDYCLKKSAIKILNLKVDSVDIFK